MSNKVAHTDAEDNIQAIVISDSFCYNFLPYTLSKPLAMLPVLNVPLIEYTLEFLLLSGVNEVFLTCCSHQEIFKSYIKSKTEQLSPLTIALKIHVVASESSSLGDCIRDIDAKGLLRGNFILIDSGVISNIKFPLLLKQHMTRAATDKGAAMTLILQPVDADYTTRDEVDKLVIAHNGVNRVLFYRKYSNSVIEKKVDIPLEMLLENSEVSLHYNVNDTGISICSPCVLPLFSDNFDFQTKDDFVKGLLMNEDILGNTIYCDTLTGSEYACAIRNWRLYQSVSYDILEHWVHPIEQIFETNKNLKNATYSPVASSAQVNKQERSFLGFGCSIGNNTTLVDTFVFDDCTIECNCHISQCVIANNCQIGPDCKLVGCVLGPDVVLDRGTSIENCFVQFAPCNDMKSHKIGPNAFKLLVTDDELTAYQLENSKIRNRRLLLDKEVYNSNSDTDSDPFRDTDDDNSSRPQSPAPDDTKMFLTEVMDSLARGFEDQIPCDNLVLEINSSRYAYNVALREVNYNVVKAILLMSINFTAEPQYLAKCNRMFLYFHPILKNYIRNEDAMKDSLKAFEDVSILSEDVPDKWVTFVLKWWYDRDIVMEDCILHWFRDLSKETSLYRKAKPFEAWLLEAEEASSSDDN